MPVLPIDPPTTDSPSKFNFKKEDQPLIGVIDTGFSGNNPDIDYSRVKLGRDRIDNDNNPLLADSEGSEHGTHVLGIIAATEGNDIGIDGINNQAPIWVGRAIGSGKWAESLKEFVDEFKASGQPTAVVNLSLDLTQTNPDGSVTTRYEFTPQEREALEYARQNHVLIVAAAGNDGGVMSVLGQASQEFDNIITVGASDGENRADYSNYGEGLDILANGGTIENPILSTAGNSVGTMAGTSVAAAEVTGAASQVWAANPQLSYRQVIDILKATATDINTPGWDRETGAGLLDIDAAVEQAKNTTPEIYNPESFLTPTTWGGEGQVTPTERAANSQTGVVNSNIGSVPLNMRTGASTTNTIVTTISQGTKLNILRSVAGGAYSTPNGTRTDWYEVQGNGKQGYVAAYYVTITSGSLPEAGYVNSNVDGTPLNVRTGSSSSNGIVTRLSQGTKLTILRSVTGGSYPTPNGNRTDWYEIEVNGQRGYAAAYYISKGTSNTGGGGSSYNRQAAVQYANLYSNTKNPAYGFYEDNNCANFVSQCLVAGGLFPKFSTPPIGNYPYTSVVGLNNNLLNNNLAEQVAIGYLSDAHIRSKILNELKPGDVILHDWSPQYGTWDHADIYLGNGNIASNTSNRNGNIFNLRSGNTRVKLLKIKS